MVATTFLHMALTCMDIDLQERFYVNHFGFVRERVFAADPKIKMGKVVWLKKDKMMLELFTATEKRLPSQAQQDGFAYPGWRHICFAVENLDEKLKEMGNEVKITLGPLDMSRYFAGRTICFVADPEGNIIELVYDKKP